MKSSDAGPSQQTLELPLAVELEAMRAAAMRLSMSIADYQYEVDATLRSKVSQEASSVLAKAKATSLK
jgi:hypothetical protein